MLFFFFFLFFLLKVSPGLVLRVVLSLPSRVLFGSLCDLIYASRASFLDSEVNNRLGYLSLEVIRRDIVQRAPFSTVLALGKLSDAVPNQKRMGAHKLLLGRNALIQHATVHDNVLLEAVLHRADVVHGLEHPVAVGERRGELCCVVADLVGLVNVLGDVI